MPWKASNSHVRSDWRFPRNEAHAALPRPARLAQRLAVAESSVQPRRWNAFVCPECRYLFRVPGDHTGRGVVCPSCRRMLRLPVAGETTPPLVLPKPEAPKAESSKDRRERQSAQVFDETFAKKEGPDQTLVRIIMAGAVTIIIVLLVGLFAPKGGVDSEDDTGASALPPELIDLTEPEKITTNTLSPDLVRKQLEPIVKKFLESSTLKEASSYTRRPTRTLQRMKHFHGGSYYSPGFRAIGWNRPMTRDGNWATIEVEDQQFRTGPITLVLEDGRWQVDWESWSGWSEMEWSTLREEKPTQPVTMRVKVNSVDYYNFSFSDESKWASYRLSDPDDVETLYGYAPSLGEIDLRLKPNPGEKDLRFTLRVRYPEDPIADNQLIIDEILAKGWVVPEDSP